MANGLSKQRLSTEWTGNAGLYGIYASFDLVIL